MKAGHRFFRPRDLATTPQATRGRLIGFAESGMGAECLDQPLVVRRRGRARWLVAGECQQLPVAFRLRVQARLDPLQDLGTGSCAEEFVEELCGFGRRWGDAPVA